MSQVFQGLCGHCRILPDCLARAGQSAIRSLFYAWAPLILALGLLAGPLSSPASAQLAINFIAVNTSESEAKDIEVKYYLPKELEPDDVFGTTGPLMLEYDVEKGAYFVHGTFKFQPKESRTFKVSIKDVFRITEDEVNVLKKQLEENLTMLDGTENVASAKVAKEKLDRDLDFILSQQSSYSADIERRIEEYRAFVDQIEQIRSSAYDISYLEHESKALEELNQQKKTLRLMLEVANPSATEKRVIKQKHYLPAEVRAEHVIEKRGFDVRYDEKTKLAFLTKEDPFGPGEKKRYEIILKDVWQFPMARLDDVDARTKLALQELTGTVYEKSAKFLAGQIGVKLQTIRDSQSLTVTPPQHIGRFRLNEQRFQQAKTDCERLEKMMSIVRSKRLKQLEVGRVQNVLQKLKALRGLAAISEALFKKGISVTLTWKVIFGVIIFVASLTTIHFFLWAKRSKSMGEETGLKPGEQLKVVKTATPPPPAK